jgi:hypothetical protein
MALASDVLPTPGTSSMRRWPAGEEAHEREVHGVPLALDDPLDVVGQRAELRSTATSRFGAAPGAAPIRLGADRLGSGCATPYPFPRAIRVAGDAASVRDGYEARPAAMGRSASGPNLTARR